MRTIGLNALLFCAALAPLSMPAIAQPAVSRVDNTTLVVRGTPATMSLFDFSKVRGVFSSKNAIVLRSSPAITENRRRLLSGESEPRGMIVGQSSEAKAGEYPWQVALVDRATPDPLLGEFCGGVVIDNVHVLTAAHCVYNNRRPSATVPPASIGVIAGQTALNVGVPVLPVRDIVIHDSWRSGDKNIRFDHDIALLTLEQPLIFNNELRSATMPSPDTMSDEDVDLRVVGWGVTDVSSPLVGNRKLRWADVRTIANEKCAKIDGYRSITENMFCASLDGAGACSGDSGGGIVNRDVFPAALVGIVSWARAVISQNIWFGCTTASAPGVYVRVSRYVDWIKARTR